MRRALLLVPLLLATLLVSAASAQVAGYSLGTSIAGPASVTAGDRNVAGLLTVAVNSATSVGSITLTSITFLPSCGDAVCNIPEAGVFTLNPTATATATATCSAQRLSVTGPDASGRYTFVPQSPIVLQPTPGASCTINFTFNALRVPSIDAATALPGVQTSGSAIIGSSAPVVGGGTVSSTSRSFSMINVLKVQPSISTQVSSSTVTLGEAVSDTATVTGSPNVALTGTVNFRLYGPDNATCAGNPFSNNSVTLSARGFAVSDEITPPNPGVYRFVATYNGDANNNAVAGVCNAPNETVTVLPAGRYAPLIPARILDTRDGTGGIVGPLGPTSTVNVQITGRGGVPATGVSAVAMNVTVTEPTGDGFLTIYPTGTARPVAANLNFSPNKTVPNLVVVKLGTNGRVDMFNSAGSTHVIYDVTGFFSDDPTGNDGRFQPLTPARIRDTRTGIGGSSVRLGPNASLDLQVTGQGGVPAAGAQAVVMNVAVTNTDATSFLTTFPTGEPRPLAANLNWVAGNTVSNRVIAKLGTNGRVTLYNAAGNTDLIVDTNGWFTDASQVGTSGAFVPLEPTRILDTRNNTGGFGFNPVPAGATIDVPVTGLAGVPANATAVILNATVVSPAGPGFLTIFPTGTARPNASDLNYAAGEVRPNLVIVKLGTNGRVSLYTPTGTHVIFDVAGFFT